LRQTPDDQFQVVGECYVHGLSDAVGFLGPLSHGWKAIMRGDVLGRPTQRFVHCKDDEEVINDPRLGPLPRNWERVICERSDDDPTIFEKFRDLDTGKIVNSDPRLCPDVLIARGVKLESFKLV
jgi:hypothetical protein